MSAFDYVILGGGCAGLSLAYELEIQGRLKRKSLAIVEPRMLYSRDKTWSFWKVEPHHHEDCVIGEWSRFRVTTGTEDRVVECGDTPYQTIDSGLFYDKVTERLSENPRVEFFNSSEHVNIDGAVVFNSVPPMLANDTRTFQHFKGLEIETEEDAFDPESVMLMDFDCDQRGQVHFFYVLPYSKNRALIETTWLGPLSVGSDDYDDQVGRYLSDRFNLNTYTVTFEEQGAIPLFALDAPNRPNWVNIGGVGGMTRLSTGYAFLNIQRHSQFLASNLFKLSETSPFAILKRYRMLDRIFLRVLHRHPGLMPSVFTRFFSGQPADAISFLSGRGTVGGDLATIWQMPKLPFLRAALGF
ncbi:MAG: lycopene cyclase family protein [Bradymonadia bacterium]